MAATPDLQARFLEDGYLVVPGVLGSEVRRQLCTATFERISQLIFQDKVDLSAFTPRQVMSMLTDQAARTELLGPEHAKIVFRDGNSRTPIISKSCGMIDVHYLPQMLEQIAANPELYQLAAQLYGAPELAFTAGLEKLCFKAPGASRMDAHTDANPFAPEVNYLADYRPGPGAYPYRIQCLAVASMPKIRELHPEDAAAVPARDAGGLSLLTNFHHYWDLYAALCHPRTGLVPLPDQPASWSRYCVLPKGAAGFERHYLPELERYARQYTDYLHRQIEPTEPEVAAFYARCQAAGIQVPAVYRPLQWLAVPMASGDVVFWSEHLPHYSNRNKSQLARVCFYYSLFPVAPSWYGSPSWVWLQTQLADLRFCYGVQANRFPTSVRNPEEWAWLQAHPAEADRVRAILGGKLLRRLTGVDSWYTQE